MGGEEPGYIQVCGKGAGNLNIKRLLIIKNREGNGNPLQYSCQGDPMDRGAL